MFSISDNLAQDGAPEKQGTACQGPLLSMLGLDSVHLLVRSLHTLIPDAHLSTLPHLPIVKRPKENTRLELWGHAPLLCVTIPPRDCNNFLTYLPEYSYFLLPIRQRILSTHLLSSHYLTHPVTVCNRQLESRCFPPKTDHPLLSQERYFSVILYILWTPCDLVQVREEKGAKHR